MVLTIADKKIVSTTINGYRVKTLLMSTGERLPVLLLILDSRSIDIERRMARREVIDFGRGRRPCSVLSMGAYGAISERVRR